MRYLILLKGKEDSVAYIDRRYIIIVIAVFFFLLFPFNDP